MVVVAVVVVAMVVVAVVAVAVVVVAVVVVAVVVVVVVLAGVVTAETLNLRVKFPWILHLHRIRPAKYPQSHKYCSPRYRRCSFRSQL